MPDFNPEAWGSRTYVMGVINVTPDSFSADGIYKSRDQLLTRAAEIATGGADIVDIGGESTRPGSSSVDLQEEVERVVPAVRALAAHFSLPLSVDTSKGEVARQALAEGATVINDVSGLRDPLLIDAVAAAGAWLVVVSPWWPKESPDSVAALRNDLNARVTRALAAGVRSDRIIVDPGLGMGKGWRENFEIMRNLCDVRISGQPLLIGPSRKGMIGRVLGTDVQDRLEGSLALAALAIAGGTDIVRVHDVRETVRLARVMDMVTRTETSWPSGQ